MTAVEWLENEIIIKEIGVTPKWLLDAFKQAKEMEQQQIIEAHIEGFYSPPFGKSRNKEAELYYNKTYKKTKE